MRDKRNGGSRRNPARLAGLGLGLMLTLGAAGGQAAPPVDVVGELTIYVAHYEDTLVRLSRRFGIGYVELVAANPGTDPWLPGEGTEIVLPTMHVLPDAPRRGLVVNLGDMRVYYFSNTGRFQGSWPIGVGRDGYDTPLGATTIVRKVKHPTWRPTESKRKLDPTIPAVVPPGPDNPLGHRALYLGWPTYVMHGTNKPPGVGRRVSLGCIRLYPEDIELLYEKVPVGTAVTVVNQPIKLGWQQGHLYIEAHPSEAQADELESTGAISPEPVPGLRDRILAAVGPSNGAAVDWDRVEQALLDRHGVPVPITR